MENEELRNQPSTQPAVPAPITFEDAMESGLVSTTPPAKREPNYFTAEQAVEQGAVERVFPTIGQQLGAAGLGAVRGAAESSALGIPTVFGAKMGSMAAPFLGPAAPLGPVVGGLAGFAYGLYASDLAGKLLPDAPSENTRAVYEGGRTTGSGIAFGPVGFLFKGAPAGSTKIREAIGALGDFARANPKTFLAQEAVASFYAGLAGMWAETYHPDSKLLRPAAEMLGAGFSTPLRTSLESATILKNTIEKGKQVSSPTKLENWFLDRITPVLDEFGENPTELASRIRTEILNLPSGARPTPAQLVDSVGLTALERTLARGNAKFSSETEQQSKQAYEAYRKIVLDMQNSGEPRLIAKAGELRKELMQRQFQTAFNQAQATALEKVGRLGKAGSDDRAAIGNILQGEIEGVLRVARQTESDLWTKAVRSAFTKDAEGNLKPVKVTADNFAQTLFGILQSPEGITPRRAASELGDFGREFARLGVKGKQLKAFKKVKVTEDFLETGRLSDDVMKELKMKDASAIDLIKVRGDLLEEARKAGATGDMGAAQRYGKLAEAILTDLDKLSGNSYAEARDFSRTLNDAFTRTFVSQLASTTPQGAARMPAEVLVQRSFNSGVDTTLTRMKQMQEAASFVDPTGAAAVSVRDAEQKVMRALASKAVKEDGSLDLASFNRFKQENADTLRFLGMDEEFKDIASAQRALLDVGDPASRTAAAIKDEIAFARLLEFDDPAIAISNALTNSKHPVKSFTFLADLAKEGGEPARRGLVSSIYQYVYHSADKSPTGFSFKTMEDMLFKPMSPNNPSLANMLRSTDLVSSEELARLKGLLVRMKRTEDALTSKQVLSGDELFSPADDAERLAVAMLGAKFASFVNPGGPGSLSFASRAISMFGNIFTGMPAKKRYDFMLDVAKDPSLMASVLEKGKSPAERRASDIQILRRLYSPGVFPTAVSRYIQDMDAEYEQEQSRAPEPGPTLRPRPPAPLTRGTPNLQLPTDQGPAGQAQQAQAPGQPPSMPSNSRQMLQQLFPNDATLQTTPMG